MREKMIDAAGLPIAVREHGGTGTPLLLLHGAGGNLAYWQGFAPLLTERFRVLSMDLRGHGRSGEAPWRTDAVLADIEAVIEATDLGNPVVAGVSLGGMLAGSWARRHAECPAAISLDGHRAAVTHKRCYADIAADLLDAQLSELRAMFDALAEQLAGPLDERTLQALIAKQRGYGFDEQQARDAALRSTTVHDGQRRAKPGPETLATLRHAPDFLDALPHFAAAKAPLLLVVATRDLPEMPPRFAPLMAAFRAGLRRDLAAIDNPHLWVRELDASHGMVFERPEAVAELVADFVAND